MKQFSWFNVLRWAPLFGQLDADIESALQDIAHRSGVKDAPIGHVAEIYYSALTLIEDLRSFDDEWREWVEDPDEEAGAGTKHPRWISASQMHARDTANLNLTLKLIDELSQLFADGLTSTNAALDMGLDFQDALIRQAMMTLKRNPPSQVRQVLASIVDPQVMLIIWRKSVTKERERHLANAPKKGARADDQARLGIDRIALGWILLRLDEGCTLGDSVPTARNGGMRFCGDIYELCTQRPMSHSVLRKRLQEFRASFPDYFGKVLTETEATSWRKASATSMAACRVADEFSNLFPLHSEIDHPPHVVRYLKRREAYYAKMRRLRI